MIHFFCGAQKNGSHFQMWVLTEGLELLGIPYQFPGSAPFHNRSLAEGKQYLDELDTDTDTIYVCKGHWGSADERDALLSLKNIRVYMIWRDIRDAMVSNYFYQKNKFNASYRSFSEFFWSSSGQKDLIDHQIGSRRVWYRTDDARVFHSSYSELRTDFKMAAGALLHFAGVENADMAELKKRTSMERLREKIDDPNGEFIRRGAVGEAGEVIDSNAILAKISKLEATVARPDRVPSG